MHVMFVVCLLALSSVPPAFAQAATEPVATAATPIRDLDTIVITGTQPGPGMWKVSKGDHVLWVLGTVSPLPKDMQWQSRDVEAVLAQAQEVIWAPSVSVTAKIGVFKGLMLAPKALGARKNPDGATLRDVVPSDMYSRWQVLKRKYIGADRGIEKWRPIFAADELYGEAMKDAGLVGGIVGPVIARAIKARKPKETYPGYRLVIEDPKATLNEFRASRLEDMDCFGKTLQRLETDIAAMRLRANAWAVGDIEALRGLPYSDQDEACAKALAQSAVVRKRKQGDLDAEMRTSWLEAAEKAMAANAVSFSTLPMRELLKPDGYLAALQARGYAIEAPE